MTKRRTDPDQRAIAECLRAYSDNAKSLKLFLEQMRLIISSSDRLEPLIHTIRPRLKSAESLADKLNRKLAKAREAGEKFEITPHNLFEKINDLVGVRVLHLHRGQLAEIHRGLNEIVVEQEFRLLEVFARTWDDRSREFFRSIGIPTEVSPTMYTSVHYVIASGSKQVKTCEIQVRTLLEEVWGEIDHSINYPHPMDDVACTKQLETLAHAIMGATANVDGIVQTVAERKRRDAPPDIPRRTRKHK
jgi:putative GTP pyrophosphokinase